MRADQLAVRVFAMSDVVIRNFWRNACRIRQSRELAKMTGCGAKAPNASRLEGLRLREKKMYFRRREGIGLMCNERSHV